MHVLSFMCQDFFKVTFFPRFVRLYYLCTIKAKSDLFLSQFQKSLRTQLCRFILNRMSSKMFKSNVMYRSLFCIRMSLRFHTSLYCLYGLSEDTEGGYIRHISIILSSLYGITKRVYKWQKTSRPNLTVLITYVFLHGRT